MLDVSDTIAAIAVPLVGAARGIVRVSGPQAIAIAERCFTATDCQSLDALRHAMVIPGTLQIALAERKKNPLPCDAYVWPGRASNTRQPTVELHMFGSPPLLQASLRTLCEHGARLAEPGEFTLRAFLAGRLDLTQAEAVLGVIDARSGDALHTALRQLAGGFSQPLASLRANLIDLLADLEAELDFVEEDIEFVSRDEVLRRVDAAAGEIRSLLDRLAGRDRAATVPRFVLVGPPNSGKSSLFNALMERYASGNSPPALVSGLPGTTRDYLSVRLDLDGVACDLVDTAGAEEAHAVDAIALAAQQQALDQGRVADLRIHCIAATDSAIATALADSNNLAIHTKCDLLSNSSAISLHTSAFTGAGLDELASELRRRAAELAAEETTGIVAVTSSRCRDSLDATHAELAHIRQLVSESAGEELIAAELRAALLHLGRVVGTVYTDDILDQLFSRFCIGK